MNTQPTASERRKWLRRAVTIAAKAADLQSEMLSALGETHVWTDHGDNLVDYADSLVGVLEQNTDRRHA